MLKKLVIATFSFFLLTASTDVNSSAVSISKPIQSKPVTAKYTVKKGETLTSIAHTLYGRASAWKAIYEFNQDMIQNPHRILPGMEFTYSLEAAEISKAEVVQMQEFRRMANSKQLVVRKKASDQTAKAPMDTSPTFKSLVESVEKNINPIQGEVSKKPYRIKAPKKMSTQLTAKLLLTW